jgi:Heparinase II/III-like protein
MKLTPINSGEAIFEAFFDEHLSTYGRWTVEGAARGITTKQGWCWAQYEWEGPPADPTQAALVASGAYDVDCSRHETLILSMIAPEGATVTLAAQTDLGARRSVSTPFAHLKRELRLPLEGARRLASVTVEIRVDPAKSPGTVTGWFNWIGLEHAAELARHLGAFSRFDAAWEEYLKPESYQPSFEPAYGLHLTAVELEQARAALAAAGGRSRSPLEELAADARRLVPEAMIGEFVNFWNDTRICRERDVGKHLLTHGANAAQAAVLFRDSSLGRLAARYAMSLAHCTRWDASFMVWMPGSKWEQRGFVPSLVMYDLALILDLCGEWFTDYGRGLILRRLAEEGHGTNNFGIWFWEYLFWCNQAAWFMPGRMLAYLVLERTMPFNLGPYPAPRHSRVAPYTELALAELRENLSNVLLPDGGYTEGPMYFTWTARQAFISLYYYARARGARMRDLVPPEMRATARMAEMLASTDDGRQVILICDAFYLNQESLAFLAWFMPDSHWVTIYRKSLARTGGQPTTLLGAALLPDIPERGPDFAPVCVMPEIGMLSSVRRHGAALVKLFIMGNQSGASHTHEDKGSFVLEFAGETFAMDFGSCDYSNPLADVLKHAQRHNMLVPIGGDRRARPANPIFHDLRPSGGGDAVHFHAELDLTPGWEGWYRRWERSWASPSPGELTITDVWELEKGDGVAFQWTTPLPIRLEGNRAVVEGRRGRAVIEIPAGCEARVEELPLENPVWHKVMEERREQVQVMALLASTQPRLSIIQRGRSGRLSVHVRLEEKAG